MKSKKKSSQKPLHFFTACKIPTLQIQYSLSLSCLFCLEHNGQTFDRLFYWKSWKISGSFSKPKLQQKSPQVRSNQVNRCKVQGLPVGKQDQPPTNAISPERNILLTPSQATIQTHGIQGLKSILYLEPVWNINIAKGTTDPGVDCCNQIHNLKNHATYPQATQPLWHLTITPDVANPMVTNTGHMEK